MSLQINLLNTGSCSHYECIVKGTLSIKKMIFPSLVVLIQHPTIGIILFDAGYAQRLHESTSSFPFSLYAKLLPFQIKPRQSTKDQLALKGIKPDDVKYIILSHFHPDHIAGLKDFPNAKILCLREALYPTQITGSFRQLLHGIFPKLLPANLLSKLNYINEKNEIDISKGYAPFKRAYDLFGDSSILAVDLSGHVRGQIGIICKAQNRNFFFIADACWTKEAYQELKFPLAIARLITWDFSLYKKQIIKLHQLFKHRPDLLIVPSHCEYTILNLIKQIEE